MPSHNTCSVFNCKWKQISMFTAPNPSSNWDLFVGWWKATGHQIFLQMEPKEAHLKIRICEAHFTIKELAELKRKMKTCIPSLNLPAPLRLEFGINYGALTNISTSADGMEHSEEVNKENIEYSRKRSSWEMRSKANKCRRMLRDSDITNVPSTSQAVMEDQDLSLLLPSTANNFQKSKSSQKSPKPLSIFQVTRKKHLSPKSLAIFKESMRLKRKARRLQHWKTTINKRLQNAQKVITSQNIQLLLETLSPFQKRFLNTS